MTFKNKELPADCFCLFTYSGMYQSDGSLAVDYSDYTKDVESQWEQILIKKKEWDTGSKHESSKWEVEYETDAKYAYQGMLNFDGNGTNLYKGIEEMQVLIVNNFKRSSGKDFSITISNIGTWGYFNY